MGKKIPIYAGFGLLALLLQLVVAPRISIQSIRPDFILLVILFIGRFEGRLSGQLSGFGFGLLTDAIGMGSFLGLSALSKTISGFLSGYLKSKKNRISLLLFYSISVSFIFIHFLIFYLINFKGTGLGIHFIILRYVIPASIYTAIFYILIDSLFTSKEDV